MARFSLVPRFGEVLTQSEGRKLQLKDILVECDMLHEHTRNDMEVWTRLFERVDHAVRYIGAKASLSVYPPERKAQKSAYSRCAKDIHARTWTISVGVGYFKVHMHTHYMGIGSSRKVCRTPTVYTLIVLRSFVSVSDGKRARVGSSARETCRY